MAERRTQTTWLWLPAKVNGGRWAVIVRETRKDQYQDRASSLGLCFPSFMPIGLSSNQNVKLGVQSIAPR